MLPAGVPLQVGPTASPGTPSINDSGGTPAAPRFDLQGPRTDPAPGNRPSGLAESAVPDAFDFDAFDLTGEGPRSGADPNALEGHGSAASRSNGATPAPASISSPDADPFGSPSSGLTAAEPAGRFDPFGNQPARPAMPAPRPGPQAYAPADPDQYPGSDPAGYPGSEPANSADESVPEPGVAYPDGHPSAAFQPTPSAGSQATPPPPPKQWKPAGTGQAPQPNGPNTTAKIVALIAVIAVVVTGAILIGVNQLGSGGQSAQSTATSAAAVSRPVPPGWTNQFAWSTAIEQVNEIAVNQNRIALLQGNQLVVLNADNGAEVSRSTATFSPNAKPFIAMAQNVPVAGIIDGSNLLVWPLNAPSGTQPKQITLSRGAKMNQVGFGLMVATGSENWMVDANLNLVAVTIPGDHEALGVTADGEMVSAPTTSSWQFNPAHPGNAPRTVRVSQNAPDTVGEMTIAWLSRGVVAAWGRTADDAVRTVGLYDVNDGRLLASGKLSTDQVNAGMPLTVSPGGEFAAAGPLLVRLADGTSKVVDRWSTIKADAKNIYGTRDGMKMVWTGQGDPQELPADSVIPWGMSDQRLAIVLDAHPSDNTKFLLGGLKG
ncbi:hypothetical protein [Granulicoccus phenolivorans]|uniref:hypothetical protein n=1 Tax=Granulicoccus phenolivorans TaxID=266854 RepID=UPI0004138929|nr:hypothetical protein [Granulicoccus phenolivorans]